MSAMRREIIAARLRHSSLPIPNPATARKRNHSEMDEPEAERAVDCTGADDLEKGRIVKRPGLAATSTHPNNENHAPANYIVGEKHAADSTEPRVVLGEIIYADGRIRAGKDSQIEPKHASVQRRDGQAEEKLMEMNVDDGSYGRGDGNADFDGDVVMGEANLIEGNEGGADSDVKIARSGRSY